MADMLLIIKMRPFKEHLPTLKVYQHLFNIYQQIITSLFITFEFKRLEVDKM